MIRQSPPLFPRESLVEQCQDLGDVELHILKIQGFLIILLHLQKVVELQIELQEATISSWCERLALHVYMTIPHVDKVEYSLSTIRES